MPILRPIPGKQGWDAKTDGRGPTVMLCSRERQYSISIKQRLWSRVAQVQILAPPILSYMTLGKVLDPSLPQFSRLYNGDDDDNL